MRAQEEAATCACVCIFCCGVGVGLPWGKTGPPCSWCGKGTGAGRPLHRARWRHCTGGRGRGDLGQGPSTLLFQHATGLCAARSYQASQRLCRGRTCRPQRGAAPGRAPPWARTGGATPTPTCAPAQSWRRSCAPAKGERRTRARCQGGCSKFWPGRASRAGPTHAGPGTGWHPLVEAARLVRAERQGTCAPQSLLGWRGGHRVGGCIVAARLPCDGQAARQAVGAAAPTMLCRLVGRSSTLSSRNSTATACTSLQGGAHMVCHSMHWWVGTHGPLPSALKGVAWLQAHVLPAGGSGLLEWGGRPPGWGSLPG